MKLNLASGEKYEEGYHNVDWSDGCKNDQVANILEPQFWEGLKDSSVTDIRIYHFLEHIPHQLLAAGQKDGLIWFMEQCWRVLDHGGRLEIRYPHHMHGAAYSDPTHTRFIGEHTLWYFSAPWRKMNGLSQMKMNCDYDLESHVDAQVMPGYIDMEKSKLNWEATQHWNVLFEIRMAMRAVKPCR